MKQSDHVLFLITTGTGEEAQLITRRLVEQKRAACASIIHRVSSLFWWQGKLDSAQESLIIIKTKAAQVDDIVRLVKGVHSYEVPEVIALPIIGGNPDYLKWMDEVIEESPGE